MYVNLDTGKLHFKQGVEKSADSFLHIFNFIRNEISPKLQKLKDELKEETPSLLNPYGQQMAARSMVAHTGRPGSLLLNQSFTGKEQTS